MLDIKKTLCGQDLELSRLLETLLTSFQCLKSQWKPWDDMFFPLFVFDICGAKRHKLFPAGPTTWQRTKKEIWQAKALLSELGIWPSTNSSVCPQQSLNTEKVSQINTSKNLLTNNFLGSAFFFITKSTVRFAIGQVNIRMYNCLWRPQLESAQHSRLFA